jgi:hypothetical protein
VEQDARDQDTGPETPREDAPFPGEAPRWREVPRERESEKDRRAHDRAAPRQDEDGSIDRPGEPGEG